MCVKVVCVAEGGVCLLFDAGSSQVATGCHLANIIPTHPFETNGCSTTGTTSVFQSHSLWTLDNQRSTVFNKNSDFFFFVKS